MKRFILVLLVLIAALPISAGAQLRPPNQMGVAMGAWYTVTSDVDSSRKFWVLMGGKAIRIEGVDAVKFPGVLIFIRQGQPSGGTEGSVIDHVGFQSPDGAALVSKLKAAGVRMGANAGTQRSVSWGYIYSPDGIKIEILDSAKTTAGIGLPEIPPAIPLTGSIAADHVHFFYQVSDASLGAMQSWYAKTFGAQPFVDPVSATGATILAANIPGIELKFGKSAVPVVPTKGRVFDRIGFEVTHLELFCKTLEKSGVKFDEPYSKTRHKSYASAKFTDPWGASIELTEGLNKF